MGPGAQQVLSKRLFNGRVGGRCPQFSLDMLLFSLCPLGDPAWPVSVTVVVQGGPYGPMDQGGFRKAIFSWGGSLQARACSAGKATQGTTGRGEAEPSDAAGGFGEQRARVSVPYSLKPRAPQEQRCLDSAWLPFPKQPRAEQVTLEKKCLYVRLSSYQTVRAVLVTTWNPHGAEQGRAHSGHPGEFSE